MLKRLLVVGGMMLVALLMIGGVVAQDLGFGDPFDNICVSLGAPKIEALPVPLYGAYFRSQFVDMQGNVVMVYFDAGSKFTGARAVYAGSYKWCPEAEPR